MSRTMRAFRLLEWQQTPQLVETSVPQPGPGQVLVKVAGNGLCHSDLHMMQLPAALGPTIGWDMPFTLGHETAGWIDSWGDGVNGWREGQAVALVSPMSCGRCQDCLAGFDNVCDAGGVGRGYGRDGGLAEYVLVDDTRLLISLNNLDPVSAGPLTDAGATSFHGFDRIRPKLQAGSTALLIGPGGLGSFALQYIKLLTRARLIVADIAEARLQAARALGADACINSGELDLAHEVMQLTEGQGVAAVMDFVGNDATIKAGIACLGKRGSFCLVGADNGGYAEPLFHALARKEADLFSFQGPSIADTRAVLELAAEGALQNPVQLFSLDEAAEAYRQLGAGELDGRAVITPAQ